MDLSAAKASEERGIMADNHISKSAHAAIFPVMLAEVTNVGSVRIAKDGVEENSDRESSVQFLRQKKA